LRSSELYNDCEFYTKKRNNGKNNIIGTFELTAKKQRMDHGPRDEPTYHPYQLSENGLRCSELVIFESNIHRNLNSLSDTNSGAKPPPGATGLPNLSTPSSSPSISCTAITGGACPAVMREPGAGYPKRSASVGGWITAVPEDDASGAAAGKAGMTAGPAKNGI
jgi:hypothetical protein